MKVTVIEAGTAGKAWLEVSRAVLERGAEAVYDGQRTKELALVTLVVERPGSEDPVGVEVG
jgi:hypothetical protein